MKRYVYPETVTKDNFPQLLLRAKRVEKNIWALQFLKLVFLIISIYVVIYVLAPVIYLPFKGSPLSPSSAALLVVELIVFSYIMSFVFAFWYVERLDVIIRFIFGFPRTDEMIFAECFFIANFLENNNRSGALRRVEHFTTYLSLFTKDYFNPKRKIYADEFGMLVSGKRQVERMLFFSEGGVSGLFTNVGLALVTGNDATAHFFLKLLVHEIQQYGELRGRLARILSQITRYEAIIVAFLTILGTILGAVITYFLAK